jgi:hypothetical protein
MSALARERFRDPQYLVLALLTIWPLWLATAAGIVVWRRYQSRTIKKPA